jgi:two-component system NarL family sensor kinase
MYLLFFLSTFPLKASETDSLLRLTYQVSDPARLTFLWGEVGYAFEKNGQLDSALLAYQRGQAIAGQHQLVAWEGRSLRYEGMLHLAQARYGKARLVLRKAVELFASDSLKLDRAKTLVDLGNVYYHLGRVDTAATIYLQAARLFDALDMPPQAGIVYGNLGTLHMELAHYEEAIRFHGLNYQRAAAAGSGLHAARAAYNLGSALDAGGELEQAAHYYDSALSQAQEWEDSLLVGFCYMGLASLASKRQAYQEAVAAMQQAIPFAQDTPMLATLNNHYGYYLGLAGRYAEGKKFLQAGNELAQEHGLTLALRENLDFWREAAAANQQYAEAYQQLMAYRQLDDSLRGGNLEARLYEMEIKYETAKKEQENLRLQARVRTRTLSLLLALAVLALGGVGFFFFRKNTIQGRRIDQQEAELQRREAAKLRQEQRFIAAQAMLDGQEVERARLARELHDGLGGLLATARRMLEPNSPESHGRGLELLEGASRELRSLAHALMPGSLAHFGLRAALEDLLLAPGATAGTTMDLQLYGLEEGLSEKMQLTVYRILQELLHNMNKHAEATEAMVQLVREPGQLHLSYEDNGKGFDPTQTGGLGLDSIRRRVAYLEGSFELDTQLGRGLAVYMSFPLYPQSHAP